MLRKGEKFAGEPKLADDLFLGKRPTQEGERAMLREWLAYWQVELAEVNRLDFEAGINWGPLPDRMLVLGCDDADLELGSTLVGRLLWADGMQAAADGDFARVLERSGQLKAYGAAISPWPAWPITMCAWGWQRHASDLLIFASRATTFGDWAAQHREQVALLIAGLSDNGGTRLLLQTHLGTEQLVLDDLRNRLLAGEALPINPKHGSMAGALASEAFRYKSPLPYVESARKVIAAYRDLIRAGEPLSRFHYLSTGRERLKAALRDEDAQYAFFPIARLETDLSILRGRAADEHAAAVALAAALYLSEHGGKWPNSLDEMVPRYLPRVPMDPDNLQDTPLRFDPRRQTVGYGQDRSAVTIDLSRLPRVGRG